MRLSEYSILQLVKLSKRKTSSFKARKWNSSLKCRNKAFKIKCKEMNRLNNCKISMINKVYFKSWNKNILKCNDKILPKTTKLKIF